MSEKLGQRVEPKPSISTQLRANGIGTRMLAKQRNIVITINTLLLFGCGVAFFEIQQVGLKLSSLIVFLLMYGATTIGVTVGFHRYFTHKTFETVPAVKATLAILGCTAAQGPLIYWVANHRRHHQYSDQPGDPHSPRQHGADILGRIRGIWHAHLGWLLNGDITNSNLFARDLLRDSMITRINHLYFLWVLLGLLVPALLGGLLSWSWEGAWQSFLLAGIVRLFLCLHLTYAINSFGHVLGDRAFPTREYSTNNFFLAVLTFGEGWHNNHHAFPSSARFGLEWWQIDVGSWVIRTLERVDLASNVKSPSPSLREAKDD
jgi:stearoyl-CoA desaturase (Delta-9 desaturase)